MSVCPQCLGFQPRRQGLWCNPCKAALMRRTRPKYRELSAGERKRNIARSYANVYQRRGKLKPKPCEFCGARKAQKYHDDYTKPLAVTWICKRCRRSPTTSNG